MVRRNDIDWEAVELQYRAGIRSLKDIGKEFGVSDAGILKRAKRDGWARDLGAKIRARAEAKVSAAAVSGEVSANRRVAEREIVEANATAIVQVRLGQRRDIQRGRSIVMSLFAELEASCGEENVALLNRLGEMLRDPDEFGNDKLNDLYGKIISLPGRARTMKDLTASLATLIGKEREAFGLDSASDGDVDPTKAMATGELMRLREALLKAGGGGE